MWDAPVSKQDALILEKLKRNGGRQVRLGDRRLWSNGKVILDRVKQEKERREWRKCAVMKPVKSRPWGAVMKAATKEQIERREVDVFEVMRMERNPARIHIGNDEVYDMERMVSSGTKSRTRNWTAMESNLPGWKKSDISILMECTRKCP